MMVKAFLLNMVILSQTAVAYDCNSDCGKAAEFRYPCPTFGNPGRKCKGREPIEFAACETVKVSSCQLWEGAVDAVKGKIKPFLQDRFNAASWSHAQNTGTENDYMASCVAAGVSACAILGTEVGGPWGAVMSGAIGTFVSFRICEQSRAW